MVAGARWEKYPSLGPVSTQMPFEGLAWSRLLCPDLPVWPISYQKCTYGPGLQQVLEVGPQPAV